MSTGKHIVTSKYSSGASDNSNDPVSSRVQQSYDLWNDAVTSLARQEHMLKYHLPNGRKHNRLSVGWLGSRKGPPWLAKHPGNVLSSIMIKDIATGIPGAGSQDALCGAPIEAAEYLGIYVLNMCIEGVQFIRVQMQTLSQPTCFWC